VIRPAVVKADFSVGVEEAHGMDRWWGWRQLLQQFVEEAAFRTAGLLSGGAGFVVPADEFLRIDQGHGAGRHGERVVENKETA